MPRIISGSSAGSLVCAYISTIPYEALGGMLSGKYVTRSGPYIKFKYKSQVDFLKRLLSGKAIFCIEHLKTIIKTYVGDLTFKEVYEKYGWNLNITVTDTLRSEDTRLLNYLTAPHVLIYTAACASSAIPFMFEPVELL